MARGITAYVNIRKTKFCVLLIYDYKATVHSCQKYFVQPAKIVQSHSYYDLVNVPTFSVEGWNKVQKAGSPSSATIHCPTYGLGEHWNFLW